MRAAMMTAASLALTMTVLGNAWSQRQQFYPSVVYITKSNPSMAVIYLQSLVMVILMGKLMRKVFFGQLRAAEFEHLMERSWYAVTETCLAFTVFKDDFSPKFVALFTLLLFLKSFHWLAEDRVDYMERSPVITLLFHLRVLSLSMVLAALDMFFIQHAYTSTLTKGASVQLVFGFEYAILLTIVINLIVKYVLHSIDLHSENPWENKAVFMLYTELFIGFVKVLLYILFFVIMVRIYTLPLFAVRPMYLTMRAFKKAFNDVVLSRRAIHNMNTLYPDATAEELANTDNVCIICREEMSPTPGSTKKLPCGHIFHRNCLRSWFQRQQTCPTCRLDVLRAPASSSAPGQQQPQPQQQQQQQQQPAQMLFQQQMAALRNNLEQLQRQRQQQQGQTQPQQAQAGQPQQQQPNNNNNNNNNGIPPNMFNMMAGGGIPPLPPFPFHPPQQPGTAAGQPTAAGAAGGQPGSGSTGARSPGFMFPPTFPFVPFTVPPPQPPPNFSGMSEAELREMEGTERSNVEARIRCLRNIQVLLDAAVMEMQQYSSVVARTNITTPATATTSATTSATATTSAPVTSADTPTVSTGISAPSTSQAASTQAQQTAADQKPTAAVTSAGSNCSSAASSADSSSSTAVSVTASVSAANVSASVSIGTSEAESSPGSAAGSMRPSSETGARPKTSVTSAPVSTPLTTTNGQDQAESEEKADNDDHEKIRQRRLAVFEEQKRRLMKKSS